MRIIYSLARTLEGLINAGSNVLSGPDYGLPHDMRVSRDPLPVHISFRLAVDHYHEWSTSAFYGH